MGTIEEAVYHRQSIEEFMGNPLIEALPPIVSPEDYSELLLVMPPYFNEFRQQPDGDRLINLQRIAEIHVPTSWDHMIMHAVSRCLRWSYVNRNPMDFNVVRDVLTENGVHVTKRLQNYLQKKILAPIYGFPIIGISGVGKTTSIINVMTFYPKVVRHRSYRGVPFEQLQMVWLKVSCPVDGTPKALCTTIIHMIDKTLKSNYSEKIVRNRMSKDVLLVKVCQLVDELNLGILIIDDIQNLIGVNSSVSKELLNFMVTLTNSLSVPVVMVGTPKILNLFQKELQQAKRASGEGEVHMMLMARESAEWDRFLRILWRYQYTRTEVSLTPAMNESLYNASVGNAFFAALIYKVVQDLAILDKRENFTVEDIRYTADVYLGMTAEMRSNLLNNIDVDLGKFQMYWNKAGAPAEEEKSENGESGKDTNLELNLLAVVRVLTNGDEATAKSIVRKTMAALPNEKELEALTDYALQLIRLKRGCEAKEG